MPFYHDYSDENAVILLGIVMTMNLMQEEPIEPENLEKPKIIIPKSY